MDGLLKMKSRKKVDDFFSHVLILFIILVVLIILIYFAIISSMSISKFFPEMLFSGSDLAIDFLGTISKIQSTIFGLFLSISFLVAQQYVPNKYISPHSLINQFKSVKFIILTIMNIISIIYNLILLKLSEDFMINMLFPTVYSLFSIILILPYMYLTIFEMINISIINEIRDNNSRFNLEGMDFSNNVLMKVNLSQRLLNWASFKGSRLIKVDFSFSELMRTDFSDSEATDVNFEESNLTYSKFSNCIFKDAKFNRAKLNLANMSSATLEKCEFTEAASLKDVNFQNAILRHSNFVTANLESANLVNADLCGANLSYIGRNEKTLKTLILAKIDETTIMDADLRDEYLKTKSISNKLNEKLIG